MPSLRPFLFFAFAACLPAAPLAEELNAGFASLSTIITETGDPVAAAYALLHDAHEAYIGDWSTPLKRALVLVRRVLSPQRDVVGLLARHGVRPPPDGKDETTR